MENLTFIDSLGKPSLRVKFGPGAGAAPDRFIPLPITVSEAKSQSWKQEKRADKALPSLVMYCDPSFFLCVLFDDNEYAAGLQVALPQKDFKDAVWDWKVQGYVNWTPSNGQTYWAKQQYFVNEAFLKSDAKQRAAKRNPNSLLQADSVWVSGINGELFEITKKPEPLLSRQFVEQGCFPGMGLHFWRLNPQTKCDNEFFPWFVLNNKQRELVGSGMGVPGKLDPKVLPKDYFERPNEAIVKAIVPHGPQCLFDLTNNPGFVTLHVYYVDEPWKIAC
ncbi:hypothetical protein NE865_01740 [Phthorimaea operculella]|nr:hypothetical protein NE865_01740 [Phthorimaea operculella]